MEGFWAVLKPRISTGIHHWGQPQASAPLCQWSRVALRIGASWKRFRALRRSLRGLTGG